mgnify:CR=1 FL=1
MRRNPQLDMMSVLDDKKNNVDRSIVSFRRSSITKKKRDWIVTRFNPLLVGARGKGLTKEEKPVEYQYWRCCDKSGVALRNSMNLDDRYKALRGPEYNDFVMTTTEQVMIPDPLGQKFSFSWIAVQIESDQIPGQYVTKYIPSAVKYVNPMASKLCATTKQARRTKRVLVQMPAGFNPSSFKQVRSSDQTQMQPRKMWYSLQEQESELSPQLQSSQKSSLRDRTPFLVDMEEAYQCVGGSGTANQTKLTKFLEDLPEHKIYGGISLSHGSGYGVCAGMGHGDDGNWKLSGTHGSAFWGVVWNVLRACI